MRRFFLVSLIVIVSLAAATLGLLVAARSVLGSDLVRSALERQLASRTGQPVRIGRATVTVYPRVALDLENVSIGDPAGIELARIRLVTGLRALWSRIVTDAEVVVHGGRIALPLPFPLVEPQASGGPDADGGGLTVQSVRVISLRDLELRGAGRTLQVDAESSLDGDRLEVARLTAHAGRTRIEAAGSFSSLSRLEGRFDAKADPLDLDEMMAIASAFTGGAAHAGSGAAAVPMRLSVTVSAASGSYAAYRFSSLAAAAEIAPGRISLSPLSVEAFGGSFSGRLDADTGKATPRLQLGGRLANVDVSELLAAAGLRGGGLTGRLAATIALGGEGAEADTLLRSSRGTISALITNGAMPGLEMVRAIVLAFGKPSGAPPGGSGSSFSRLGGTFSLADSVLTTKDLAMQGRDFDLAGSGSVSLESGGLDARADVVLSKELTSRAGTDLRRYAQEDGRVVVPGTIGGTLQQPTVALDVTAAARRALGNELRRRATSLLDRLMKRGGR
jgi:hypothetical protein